MCAVHILEDLLDVSTRSHTMKCVPVALLLAWSATTLYAQQDSVVSVFVGRGLLFYGTSMIWECDRNTSISMAYRFRSDMSIIAYLDFNSFSFVGDESPQSGGNYSLASILVGAKRTGTVPGTALFPYFIVAVGMSWPTSPQDTVFRHHHGYLEVYRAPKNNTITLLGSIGVDFKIYRPLYGFVELRASEGINIDIYNLSVMWRAGLGFTF
jgi:hypothetical protein